MQVVAPTQTRTSRQVAHRSEPMASIGLILGILWIFGLGSILALILGSRTNGARRTVGLQRSGVATAAIIVGWLGIAACIFAGALVVGAGPAPG